MGVRTVADRLAVKQFIEWLGVVPYPPPLQLNLEEFGAQEFLETAVSGGSRVSLVMLMKRFADLHTGKQPYRARFSKYASRRNSTGLATGIITRAVQYTTPIAKLKLTLLQLQAELIEEGIAKGVYSEAIYRVIQGSVCKDKAQVQSILRNTKAWW